MPRDGDFLLTVCVNQIIYLILQMKLLILGVSQMNRICEYIVSK